MANRKMKIFTEKGTHNVGVVNSSWAKAIVNGAILEECPLGLDNYTIVELTGYNEDGVAKCKPLSDETKKGYLCATNEEESLYSDVAFLQGNYEDFYNAEGEMVRPYIQESHFRFEASNYEGTPVVGHLAYYDKTKKKFVIVGAVATTEYTNAGNKYEVAEVDSSFGANLGIPTIRLMCK